METSYLQWWLTNLNQDSFDKILSNILGTVFVQERIGDLIKEMVSVYRIRPMRYKTLINLLLKIVQKKNNTRFSNHFSQVTYSYLTESQTNRTECEQLLCIRFLRLLYDNNFLKIDFIVRTLNSTQIYVKSKNLFLLIFFAPELMESHSLLFLEKISELSHEYTLHPEISPYFNDPNSSNWIILSEKYEFGWNRDSIEYQIIQDNIEFVIHHPNYTENYRIPSCYFEHNEMIRKGNISLIHFAAFYSAVNTFQLLINQWDIPGDILQYAIAGGNPEIFAILTNKGFISTPFLHIGSEYRQYDIIDHITNQPGFIDQLEVNFSEILRSAALDNNLGLLIYFHRKNLSISFENDLYFEAASSDDYIDSFQILTQFENIDINLAGDQQWTALHIAAANGSLKIIQYLASLPGIIINSKDNNGRTPLHIAAANDELEIVAFFQKCKGVDINCVDQWGRTPLHLAAANGMILTVSFLIKCPGIIINRTDGFSKTPLDLAEDPEIINILENAQH